MSDWSQAASFSNPSPFGSFGGGIQFFGTLIILAVIGIFAYGIIKGLTQWSRNNASPLVTVNCVVVGRRTEVWGGRGETSAKTSYYITFETGEGERLELELSGSDYGVIVEGDQGRLSYQGTRFKGFQRMSERAYRD
ncbi:DUF2500 domain-containing protein [Paenibacillus tengchongensis]|uniref:DUF2500 domain-containing protein n=1 Tax=Paenibacillus tengchongensis TaxID=2608684 RepID=UPI001FE662AE|nr:DUF2500 domain-containing protein [Paenibacillus tengchongensis]